MRPRKTFRDITYEVFDRAQALYPIGPDKWGHIRWQCQCSCGKAFTQLAYRLVNGQAKSCGCLARETRERHKRKPGQTVVYQHSLRHRVLHMANLRATIAFARREMAPHYENKQQVTHAIKSLLAAGLIEVLTNKTGEHLRLTPDGRAVWLDLGEVD